MYYKENSRLWYLLARRKAGEMLPEEAAELDTLLQAYPHESFTEEMVRRDWNDQHKAYTEEDKQMLLQKHRERLRIAEEKRAIDEAEAIENVQPAQDTKRSILKLLQYGSVAAAIVLGLFWGWNQLQGKQAITEEQAPQFGKQVVTKKGHRSKLVLSDSTVVWMNAGSTLDYPKQFAGNARNVQLQGEAYFEVTKDSHKPFYVHTKAFTIKVLGTGFNVRAYPDEDSAVTALVHGSVEVITPAKKSIMLLPNEKITLPMNGTGKEGGNLQRSTPGANGLLAEQQPRPMTVLQDSVQVETAWVDNKLAFRKMPLLQVTLLLEKWYGADIRFKREDKKTLRFTGVYDKEQLDEILFSLEATGSFRYTKDTSGVIWIE